MNNGGVFNYVFWGSFGLIVLTVSVWRVVKPYLILRDVKNGAVTANAMLYVLAQGIGLVAIPALAIFAWGARGPFACILFTGMLAAGCAALYSYARYVLWKPKAANDSRQALPTVDEESNPDDLAPGS